MDRMALVKYSVFNFFGWESFHFSQISRSILYRVGIGPFDLIGIAGSDEIEHLRFRQFEADDLIVLCAFGAEVAGPVDFVFLNGSIQIFGDGRYGDRIGIYTCYEVRADVVAFFVEDGDAVGFGSTAQATGDIVKNGDVVFRFKFGNRFRVHGHAAELGAALEFGKELVEFPAEALGFGSRAGLELALQFFSAEVVGQRGGWELSQKILERRGVLRIHLDGEEAGERYQDGRNCGGLFHDAQVVVCEMIGRCFSIKRRF